MVDRELPLDYMPFDDGPIDREQLIEHYFCLGFSYLEILCFLSLYHGISISIRQLHRILRNMRLRRRSSIRNWEFIVSALEYELEGTGQSLGYRSMQSRLRLRHDVNVDRETVRIILRFIDPDGVTTRRQRRLRRRMYWSKGPNYLYHIDGWDKLKPYGLCVHGCIDGFSRKIMWLEASPSNNNPFVVCKYFSDCVKQLKGVPHIVRADHGTENVNVALMQRILRHGNNDDRGRMGASFIYGRSTSNQRIEGWWSKFAGLGMKKWREHMRSLVICGIIDTSKEIVVECIRYCYLKLLRKELNLIKIQWNTHHIRSSRASQSPSGKPDIMFYFPEVYDTQSYLEAVDPQEVAVVRELSSEQIPDCVPLYQELFDSIVAEATLDSPNTLQEAAQLLAAILDTVDEEVMNL